MPGGSCGNLTAALAPKFPRSTKPAPLFCDLSRRTAQHRSFPAPWSVYSHPLQNRVPRVQVLLPLPKTALLLLQWRCFLSLGGTSWQQGAPAGPPAVRVVGRVRASGALPRTDRGGSRDKSDVYLCLFSHPSAPAAPPSSTQNAPGSAFFGLNRVRFADFALF